ncbi:hypothetical protein TSAR_003484 [Trichomalopsis sarcophagae]|uniref:Odorant receptor n=1 Tax=Trichomalopsis sarcophagae TaxID=543379 RepID=A0A232EYB0_9HYME|nr:hypothetical protein TSAR_003484 [Trichomalopsis sarcophagae]
MVSEMLCLHIHEKDYAFGKIVEKKSKNEVVIHNLELMTMNRGQYYPVAVQIKRRYERIAVDWIKLADDSEREIIGTFLLEARSAIFVSIGNYEIILYTFLLFACITFLPRIFRKQSMDQCLQGFPYYLRSMVINETTCIFINQCHVHNKRQTCLRPLHHRLRNAEVYVKDIGPLKDSIEDTPIIPSLIKVIDIHKKALRLNIPRLIGVLAFLAVLMFEVQYHGGNVNELLRFSPILLIALIYVYFINWCGEQVIESCNDLRITTYNIDWYRISSRVHIFVLMVMQRTAKPKHLTAGTVIMLSIENFAIIIKTSYGHLACYC